VLMDVQMPVMDGFAATRSIRSRGFAALPIIALTANAFPEDAKLCREAGMSDFLAKPLRKRMLISAILRAVDSVAPAPRIGSAMPPTAVPDQATIADMKDRTEPVS
jgi:two-component system, sensor histidine kinase